MLRNRRFATDARLDSHAMDEAITHALNAFLLHHDAVEDPATLYMAVSEALFALLLVALVAVVPLVTHRLELARAGVAAGISAGTALLIGQVLSHLVDRSRPFVEHPGAIHLFSPHAADPGFPSDHAIAAFAIGTALLLRERRLGVPVLVAAALLAAGRVAVGVHFPTDVLAGAALGAAVAIAVDAAPIRTRIDALVDRLAGRLPVRFDGLAAG